MDSNEELGKIFSEILLDSFDPLWVASPEHFFALSPEDRGFDLIVTEIEFPGGGWQNTAILERCPVLIVTRVDDTKIIQSMLNGWADDYLTKPFNNNEFLAKCRRLTAGKKVYECHAVGMSISCGDLMSEELTANEFRLLTLLSHSQNYSVEIGKASQLIFGQKVSDQRLHTMLSRLRPKVKALNLQLEMSKETSTIWLTQVVK